MPTGSVSQSSLGFLKLIAHPQRWRLLSELARSDLRVAELCSLVGEPQNLVSYHLRELRNGGLVSARQSSADGRDTYYRAEIAQCAELLGASGADLHPGARLSHVPVEPVWPSREAKPQVLFLCTGNSARSQMAEALLIHRSAGAVLARSAGSHPKPLHPNAVRAMAERGIDISGNATKHLEQFVGTRFGHVITLCDKVREICPDFPGQPVTAHWSMADPAAEGDDDTNYAAFVRAADEVESRVALLYAQLTDELRQADELQQKETCP